MAVAEDTAYAAWPLPEAGAAGCPRSGARPSRVGSKRAARAVGSPGAPAPALVLAERAVPARALERAPEGRGRRSRARATRACPSPARSSRAPRTLELLAAGRVDAEWERRRMAHADRGDPRTSGPSRSNAVLGAGRLVRRRRRALPRRTRGSTARDAAPSRRSTSRARSARRRIDERAHGLAPSRGDARLPGAARRRCRASPASALAGARLRLVRRRPAAARASSELDPSAPTLETYVASLAQPLRRDARPRARARALPRAHRAPPAPPASGCRPMRRSPALLERLARRRGLAARRPRGARSTDPRPVRDAAELARAPRRCSIVWSRRRRGERRTARIDTAPVAALYRGLARGDRRRRDRAGGGACALAFVTLALPRAQPARGRPGPRARRCWCAALAACLGVRFGRVQFTPDLMPSDIIGTPVLDPRAGELRFRPGPLFTDLLLADEINRAVGEDAGGAARGDAGARRHGRRREPPARPALRRVRDAEPGRARRHLSAARGRARPLPLQDRDRATRARRTSARSSRATTPRDGEPARAAGSASRRRRSSARASSCARVARARRDRGVRGDPRARHARRSALLARGLAARGRPAAARRQGARARSRGATSCCPRTCRRRGSRAPPPRRARARGRGRGHARRRGAAPYTRERHGPALTRLAVARRLARRARSALDAPRRRCWCAALALAAAARAAPCGARSALVAWDALLLRRRAAARAPSAACRRARSSGQEAWIELRLAHDGAGRVRADVSSTSCPRDVAPRRAALRRTCACRAGRRHGRCATRCGRGARRPRARPALARPRRSPLGFFRRRAAPREGALLRVYPDTARLLRPGGARSEARARGARRRSRPGGAATGWSSSRSATTCPATIRGASTGRRARAAARPVVRLHQPRAQPRRAHRARREPADGRARRRARTQARLRASTARARRSSHAVRSPRGDRVGLAVFDRALRRLAPAARPPRRARRLRRGAAAGAARARSRPTTARSLRALAARQRQRALDRRAHRLRRGRVGAARRSPSRCSARRHRLLLVAIRDPLFAELEAPAGAGRATSRSSAASCSTISSTSARRRSRRCGAAASRPLDLFPGSDHSAAAEPLPGAPLRAVSVLRLAEPARARRPRRRARRRRHARERRAEERRGTSAAIARRGAGPERRLAHEALDERPPRRRAGGTRRTGAAPDRAPRAAPRRGRARPGRATASPSSRPGRGAERDRRELGDRRAAGSRPANSTGQGSRRKIDAKAPSTRPL